MPAPLLIPLGIKALCWCGTLFGIGYVCKKGHDAYKQGQKTKQQRLALKGKSIEQAREENKKTQEEVDEWKKKHEQQERENKKFEEEIRSISDKLKDPNISKEEKEELKNRLTFLQTQLDEGKNKSKTILDTIKGLGDRIKNNNKVISGTISNLNDNHWIWEFLTLENIMIMGACYVLYQLMKEEKGIGDKTFSKYSVAKSSFFIKL